MKNQGRVFQPQALLARRQILEWRDKHKIAANLALTRNWQDLVPQVEAKLDEVTWYQASVSPSDFIISEIDPILVQGFSACVSRLVAEAQADLLAIMDHQLVEVSALGAIDQDDPSLSVLIDIFKGISPLAGGLALGAALPSMAVVSGTTAFGLVATSTISMPILIGGLVLAGGAVATGVVETSKLREVRSKRMLKRVRRHVDQAVFSLDIHKSEDRKKSIILQIHDSLDTAVETALDQIR